MKRILSLLLLIPMLLTFFSLPTNAAEPDTQYAESTLLYCFHTDTVLYEKDAEKALAVGNTAQLMTALLTLEAYPDLDVEVTLTPELLPGWYTEGDYRTPADYGFTKGATLPVKDLIAAVVIENANCASLFLASLIAGSRDAFTEKMNTRAKELGMTDTVYQNPTGLDAAGAQTTARDVMLLARALYEIPAFTALAASATYTLSASRFTVYTRNYFIGKWYTAEYVYSRANGMKAGYTDKAGYTLVATATETDGYSYLAIVLGAKEIAFKNTSYGIARSLFTWGSTAFSYREVLSSAKLVTTLPVTGGDGVSNVPLFPKEAISAYLPKAVDSGELTLSYTLRTDSLTAPFEKGTEVGEVSISYNGKVIASTALVTGNAVVRSQNASFRDFAKKVLKWVGIALAVLVGISILRFALRHCKRNER